MIERARVAGDNVQSTGIVDSLSNIPAFTVLETMILNDDLSGQLPETDALKRMLDLSDEQLALALTRLQDEHVIGSNGAILPGYKVRIISEYLRSFARQNDIDLEDFDEGDF